MTATPEPVPPAASTPSDASVDGAEALYRLLAESTNELVTLYNASGDRVYASPSCVRVLGAVPAATLAGIHPDDLAAARAALARALAGETVSLTYRHARYDGTWLWLEAHAAPVQYRGRPHVIAISRDVTERRHAEEQYVAHLRFLESLDRVNRAMQATSDLEQMMGAVLEAVLDIFEVDRAWLVYPCDPDTPSWRVPMERTRPEFPGVFARGVEVPTSAGVADVMRMLLARATPLQFGPDASRQVPGGAAVSFGVRAQMVMAIYPKVDKPWAFGLHQCSRARVWTPGEERLFQEIGRRLADTLDTLLMFRNLRESERRLADAERIAHMGWWDRDLETGRVDSSDHAYRVFGLSPASRVDRLVQWDSRWSELIHPDDRRRVAAAVDAALHGGPRYDIDYRIVRPDGVQRIVHSRAEVTFDARGRPVRMFGAIQDVTEVRRAEQALIESFSLLNAVVEGTSDAVFVKDVQGRYLMINSAGARFIGRDVNEVIGKDDEALFGGEAARTIAETDRQVFASGESLMFEQTLTIHGGPRTLLTRKSVYRTAEGEVIGLIGISSDVTERKLLEEQLRQAQKMEAIGRLAGGVAHDFNNLLTVINSYSEIVLGNLAPDDPNRPALTEIMKSGERAAKLTRQLLAFGRKQMLQPKVVSLNTILNELVHLLRRLIGEDVDLSIVPDPELGLTRVDPGQFEQAIMNLAVNARDAMPGGGRLTIATQNFTVGDEVSRRHPRIHPGPYVAVSVTDTGVGMDEATRSRVFEPFFTTKGPGKGSGLGLPMVYGFVTQSGGRVDVESEIGHGTTFTIYLPRAEEPAAAAESGATGTEPARGTETVLLVEDEAPVRSLTRIVLQTGGYTVLEAADGHAALAMARQHEGPIHLLLTDLVMPRLGGRQLAEELQRVRPGTRVLFMSGYPDEHVFRQADLEPGMAFLHKPFTPQDLMRKVRGVLDSPGTSQSR